jgi:hypothetical protein
MSNQELGCILLITLWGMHAACNKRNYTWYWNIIETKTVSHVSLWLILLKKISEWYVNLITIVKLIDYEGLRLCLRTAHTEPIIHPLGDMWACRAMEMMMPAKDNSWLVHQSSLEVLPAETPGACRRNGRRSENFAYQYLKYVPQGIFNMP